MVFSLLPSEKEFIEFNTTLGLKISNNPLISKVYAVLMSEDKYFSLDELVEITGYSLASISNAINKIDRFHSLQRMKKPGSKKIFIKLSFDPLDMLKNNIAFMLNEKVKPLVNELPRLITHLKKDLKEVKEKKDKERLKNKIKLYEDYFRKFQLMEKLLREFQKIIVEERFND